MSDLPAGLRQATADGDLIFQFTRGKHLQLHRGIISMWSKTVIKQAIASGCKRDSEDRHLLQMPDTEYDAWVYALPFMYPPIGVPPPSVTWNSAKDLLLLAHKYDMPGIKSHVINFFESAALTYNTAWEWLKLACRPQMEMPDTVTNRCINVIAEAKRSWPQGAHEEINTQAAEQLYKRLVVKTATIISKLETAKTAAEGAAAEASAAAKKQRAAAVAQYKTRVDDLSADLCWSLQSLNEIAKVILEQQNGYDNIGFGFGFGHSMQDVQQKVASICYRTGIKLYEEGEGGNDIEDDV